MTIRSHWKSQTYPYFSQSIKIIFPKIRISYTSIIFSIFTLEIDLFLIVIIFASAVTLKNFLKEKVSTAALELMRIFVMASSLKIPEHISGKIIWLTIRNTMFFLTVLMQSLLSALDSTPTFSSFVDSAQDLIKYNLTIYGTVGIRKLLHSEELSHYQVMNDASYCIRQILKGDRRVCMHSSFILRFHAYEGPRIHISKEDVVEKGLRFYMLRRLAITS